MKKLLLILPIAVLSSCLPESSNRPDDPHIYCATASQAPANDFIPPVPNQYFSVSLSPKAFALEKLPPLLRVRLNGDVVYNSCQPLQVDGFILSNSDSYLSFAMNMSENKDWWETYFNDDGTPKKYDLEMKIEGRGSCYHEKWQTLLPKTSAILDWQYSDSPCGLPGYHAFISEPIPVKSPTTD